MNSNTNGLTEIVTNQMTEFEETIYEIEDNILNPQKKVDEIIAYLKDVKFSIPFGRALRRYICDNYAAFDDKTSEYVFHLLPEKEIRVSDYHNIDYNIQKIDVEAFVELFMFINKKFNSDSEGNLLLDFPKAEARRLLKAEAPCKRDKMFLISFALHMNSEQMTKFLTDHLAEQTYNFRDSDEIIAFYCQSKGADNAYEQYLQLKKLWDNQPDASDSANAKMESGYTSYAASMLNKSINSDEELIGFLASNRANFKGFSQTAYNEYLRLLNKAKEVSKTQSLLNDEYLSNESVNTPEQLKEREARINNAIEARTVQTNEQLAREMLSCIPRYTTEYIREYVDKYGNKVKEDLRVVENDFINIKNGERGQEDSDATTTLPAQITKKLLMSGRLNDLEKQKKPVERKDLVFLRFYIFSKIIEKNGNYTLTDYQTFIDECNEMLNACGFSRLYAANRFENLIMLSLLADNPFEMFETIIEYSFFNEPENKIVIKRTRKVIDTE